MSKSLSTRSCCFLCAFTLIFSNCVDYRTVKRQMTPADSYKTLDTRSPFLKAHMRNGQVYVLSEWSVDSEELFVRGQGALLTVDRDTLSNGEFTVRIDSVAIFETNILQKSSAVNALAIITGISAVVTIACLTNPKACFGSCPTFYVSDGSRPILQAEGFSSSIAPWLEAADIDALFRAKPNGRNFRIEMRNEALETHVVRYVDLLALPKGRGRVLKDIHGKFWQVRAFLSPASCKGPEGDFSSSIESFDGDERFSMADSANLAERETLEFEFEKIPEGSVGLVIGARQTLLSTYLLYQTFSWMGNNIGDWFALFSQKKHNPDKSRLGNILGRIEVFVQDKMGNRQYVGDAGEHGPLATDMYLITLPASLPKEHTKVFLRLTKGNWRIDYLGLAKIKRQIAPLRIKPSLVLKNGSHNQAVSLLNDSSKVLITLPGDTYTLEYLLPEDFNRYELFLESRGYYLEWMRQEWLEEESPERLAQMIFSTKTALKKLAPDYKKVEPGMEDLFWRSQYAKP